MVLPLCDTEKNVKMLHKNDDIRSINYELYFGCLVLLLTSPQCAGINDSKHESK